MTAQNYIPLAASILKKESESLILLASCLNESFNQSVKTILARPGRVAVTGMGKSGHVARKVAATLASTGTPSFFIHPAEAGHGDLGMLQAGQDTLLAFSNSGQTVELAGLLQFCLRSSIMVIGVTADDKSILGRHSDLILTLPRVGEACPLGCAPTTSTTMMMALGDALALSLLEARGFTLEDFRLYHPGGQLGSRLLAVGDLMHTGEELPLANLDEPMSAAILTMSSRRLGCLGVVAQGRLVGMLTDGDLRRHMGPNLMETACSQIMTANPVTFTSGMLAAKALAVMQSKGITNAFVTQEEQPIGVIHIHDIIAAGVV
ncbi:MAG: KpsF/GutQ family sugar-phosphate isomerase [Deltaproteobacteria bacterium]|jgi:arabinose-5-phosphate isomerase|nr:KpsF/GutQ family sugar-phosphate isomerase [Deltaproteobacteria bacterium]